MIAFSINFLQDYLVWQIVIYLQVVLLFSTIDYYPIVYGNDIPYPWWGEFVGWLMTAGILCGIFIPAIYQLIVTEGTIKEVS